MKKTISIFTILSIVSTLFFAYIPDINATVAQPVQVDISGLQGAYQNPAWSPDGNRLVFSNWQGGYNTGDCSVYNISISDPSDRVLLSGSGTNVNMPGGATIWNPVTNKVIFCSTAFGEEQAVQVSPSGGTLQQITGQPNYMAWEPGFSPNGDWVVYEKVLSISDESAAHSIWKCRVDGTDYTSLNTTNDSRQPSWSPAGNLICYQKKVGSEYDCWVCNPDGTGHRQLTTGQECTDVSFSNDGKWIVFSTETSGTSVNIYACPTMGGPYSLSQFTRITSNTGYDGAPGWSQDQTKIAYEHTSGTDPDNATTSTIWITDVSYALLPDSDSTTISSIQPSGITSSGATITWTTDQSSSSIVEYGTTTSYGSSITGPNGVTSHSVALSSLSASTTYHYRVTSTNSSNFTTTSSDYTFTTSANTQTEVTVDDDNSAIKYGSGWAVYADSGDSGGSHHEVNSANKYASFTFSGTSIKWISQKDNNYGKAYVYIDNVKVSTVDLYASSTTYQQEVYSNQSLSNGSHTIKIVCTGTKNSSSSNKYITIDAFKY